MCQLQFPQEQLSRVPTAPGKPGKKIVVREKSGNVMEFHFQQKVMEKSWNFMLAEYYHCFSHNVLVFSTIFSKISQKLPGAMPLNPAR